MPVHVLCVWDCFLCGPNLNLVNFGNGYGSSLSWILLSGCLTKQHHFLASFSCSVLRLEESECLGEWGAYQVLSKGVTDV